jgi:hypothetical protein
MSQGRKNGRFEGNYPNSIFHNLNNLKLIKLDLTDSNPLKLPKKHYHKHVGPSNSLTFARDATHQEERAHDV